MQSAVELRGAYESVVRLSRNSFSDGSVYLERYVARAKHVEVQIFGDGRGGVGGTGLARLFRAAAPSEGDRGDAGSGD